MNRSPECSQLPKSANSRSIKTNSTYEISTKKKKLKKKLHEPFMTKKNTITVYKETHFTRKRFLNFVSAKRHNIMCDIIRKNEEKMTHQIPSTGFEK